MGAVVNPFYTELARGFAQAIGMRFCVLKSIADTIDAPDSSAGKFLTSCFETF